MRTRTDKTVRALRVGEEAFEAVLDGTCWYRSARCNNKQRFDTPN